MVHTYVHTYINVKPQYVYTYCIKLVHYVHTYVLFPYAMNVRAYVFTSMLTQKNECELLVQIQKTHILILQQLQSNKNTLPTTPLMELTPATSATPAMKYTYDFDPLDIPDEVVSEVWESLTNSFLSLDSPAPSLTPTPDFTPSYHLPWPFDGSTPPQPLWQFDAAAPTLHRPATASASNLHPPAAA